MILSHTYTSHFPVEYLMSDFAQNGLVTTLHDLRSVERDNLENMLRDAVRSKPLGLILPVTAADMRAAPFDNIMQQLQAADYIETICVVLGVSQGAEDYRETARKVAPLGKRGVVLWTDGERVQSLYNQLNIAGFNLTVGGKGRSVWTSFGYLLADSRLKAFALHDCDIVSYDRLMLARLCLPMAHPSFDFEFCKAYYARTTDRMHGRVVRLLVAPLLRALLTMYNADPFLEYLNSFRYPLSGEFAVSSNLAISNRVASDWGLEVGTLSEVFRNTSLKRVCQVDLATTYEHKHQDLSAGDPKKGLMKMAGDILTTIFRTLASRGVVLEEGHFNTMRSAYLRSAQDAIRQYHADAIMNGLSFDRHSEEIATEAFAQQIMKAGETFRKDPSGGESIPNWARVLTAFPEFPQKLREFAEADKDEFGE
jgi:glucosyl-3-phosphoglycerate synthase